MSDKSIPADVLEWANVLAKTMEKVPGWGVLTWEGYGGTVSLERERGKPVAIRIDPTGGNP